MPGEVVAVFLDFIGRFGSTGAKHDLGTVGAKKSAAIVAQVERDLALIGTIDVHRPEFEVAGSNPLEKEI